MPDVRQRQSPTQPRNVHIFGATSFLNDTASEMAYWILPAFLTGIGGGPATLGIIEGIAESVASFAKLFSGIWTDRIQRRKPLVVSGYVVANVVKPLLAIVNSTTQVLFIRFADRLAKGVRGAPRDVMLAESVEANKVGSAFGLLQAMDSAGAIAGPLLAIAIMSSAFGARFGVRAVFWAAAVPGLLCILVVVFGLEETQHTVAAARRSIFGDAATLPAAFYYVLCRHLAVFDWELERHVSCPASSEHRHTSFACSIAWTGLQHHLYGGIVACRLAQRPRVAFDQGGHVTVAIWNRRRRTAHLHGCVLGFCCRSVAHSVVPCDGVLRILLCAYATGDEGHGGRYRSARGARKSVRHLLFRNERCGAAGERYHGSTLENVRSSGAVPRFGGVGAGRGVDVIGYSDIFPSSAYLNNSSRLFPLKAPARDQVCDCERHQRARGIDEHVPELPCSRRQESLMNLVC